MTADHLLDVLALVLLACAGFTGLWRAVALAFRGVWVLPIDRERSPSEALADLAFVLGLLTWLYEAIVHALAPASRITVGPLPLEIPWPALRWLGLVAAGAGVSLYVLALRELGASWRFTIDRERPGELVTTGVFAFSRNPIYLSLALLAGGIGLALGNVLLALLACAAPFYFDYLIRREECFLAVHYGETYAAYCARVPRWLRWAGRIREKPGPAREAGTGGAREGVGGVARQSGECAWDRAGSPLSCWLSFAIALPHSLGACFRSQSGQALAEPK
ncbi:MAG: isoprenylcysteine carboxylmethyltransferase family protein [bacterium]|nr:isoprenylcysteine carboxylmethyltransferase family protein [bacterium]